MIWVVSPYREVPSGLVRYLNLSRLVGVRRAHSGQRLWDIEILRAVNPLPWVPVAFRGWRGSYGPSRGSVDTSTETMAAVGE